MKAGSVKNAGDCRVDENDGVNRAGPHPRATPDEGLFLKMRSLQDLGAMRDHVIDELHRRIEDFGLALLHVDIDADRPHVADELLEP